LGNVAGVAIQPQSSPAAREGEIAGIVVKLVAEHAMVVAEIVEDAAEMGRQFRPGEGAYQRS
jgi:hypothetical protein